MKCLVGGKGLAIIKSKFFIVLMFVLIFLCGIAFYFFYGTPWDYFSYKSKFETYLEDKYHKSFEIEDLYFDFFHGSTYHASANDSVLTFYVGQNTYTKEMEDGYHYETWKKQANDELRPMVEKLFPDHFNFAIEIIPESKPLAASIPNYKKYTTVEVGISMDQHTITNNNRIQELDRIYQLIKVMKEKEIPLHHLGIGYKNQTIQLESNEIQAVKSQNDIDKWLMEYRDK
jgi:hypothetical protein